MGIGECLRFVSKCESNKSLRLSQKCVFFVKATRFARFFSSGVFVLCAHGLIDPKALVDGLGGDVSSGCGRNQGGCGDDDGDGGKSCWGAGGGEEVACECVFEGHDAGDEEVC